ncbi:MAG: nucleoside deaminase [Pyrinomonadaceae bacterium]|nr:nucleoside deaminase [Pyrinomonadaceae bacterium]
MMENDRKFMLEAIRLAQKGVDSDAGGPFGALVVRRDEIIGAGWNCVTSMNDPTAHAEVMAIRKACKAINSFQLEECVLYTSCEPCPMCLGAIYWARPDRILYACTREDAAKVGFDDQFIYDEIAGEIADRKIETINFMRDLALPVFESWQKKPNKIEY